MKKTTAGISTPYYLIDERALLRNMKIIRRVRDLSGARSMLALKCFSSWAVFPLMRKYMDGTTSSSLYEARLGHDKFGGETHAYCVGYSREDILAVKRFADKIIFNSLSQLFRYNALVRPRPVGVRVNPHISHSHFDLANPARRYSRLGVADMDALMKAAPLISGVMFHFNCENDSFSDFSANLDYIGRTYGELLRRLDWVSLGGGLYFTKEGYPVEKFCKKLRDFSERFNVQVYLEPGESSITRSAHLVTKVVDIVHNEIDIAIVDACTEGHLPDLLIYRIPAKVDGTVSMYGRRYVIAGRSCLAGDVFGTFRFAKPLKVGSIVRFSDAAGYSIVKANWFNGLQRPSIAVKRLNGSVDIVRRFYYTDFMRAAS
jgi:carboxynorspermidine decarboxylase